MPSPAPLTCVIVDDNEINRLTLEHLVELTPTLTLAASLPGSVEALQYFSQGNRADLLLLDIEMPQLSGLELVRLLPKPPPAIVVVTSHRDFAVDAFELQVADYLVKPIGLGRFSQAIARVLEQRQLAEQAAAAPEGGPVEPHGSELFVKVGPRMLRLNFEDVLYIEALSTYSVLVTKTQKHIVYLTLKAITERLPFAHFARVHRSYIVNTRQIEAIEDNMLKLGPYEVPVGKSYQEAFFKQLRGL
ncbi:response regulator transcription factor [Hymenobacter lutimineralis]|uniref:Response regulator transcription factor n=1 Tax=Hymenobacter lutimineralis TaxID=2606448 RepID=A0A5D6V702_9BACT|nr:MULTISPECIES: LytTR family DNA-binding domain-containing protein [Hymenobacter]QIX62913.1 response regulator transcription factor [Hymenobacter sp. BT18]TYZ10942.1 response regulator transcription factor [Hymenobacter lutimineralis]